MALTDLNFQYEVTGTAIMNLIFLFLYLLYLN